MKYSEMDPRWGEEESRQFSMKDILMGLVLSPVATAIAFALLKLANSLSL